MFTRTKVKKMHLSMFRETALKPLFWGLLVLFLAVGRSDRAIARADTVIDRLPETTTAVVQDQGNSLFLNQVLFAGIVVWVISLLVGKKD
jgi:hypothetical protein